MPPTTEQCVAAATELNKHFNPPMNVNLVGTARGDIKKSQEAKLLEALKNDLIEISNDKEIVEDIEDGSLSLSQETINTLNMFVIVKKGVSHPEKVKEKIQVAEEPIIKKITKTTRESNNKIEMIRNLAMESQWTRKEIVKKVQRKFGGSKNGTQVMISHGKKKEKTSLKGLIVVGENKIVSFVEL